MERLINKSALLLTLCIAFAFSAKAQDFDWVKTYTGPTYNQDEYHMPVSSVTDADGNLYLLGRFVAGARMDTTHLLPITGANWICTWIAKLTPMGELAWHKAIYARQGHSLPYDIRNVGDSAVMVMANFMLPYHYGYVSEDNPVYYLDSIYTTAEGLMPTDSMENHVITTTAFITLDLDGHVMEQHFLQLGYVDSTGATLRSCNTGGAPGDSCIVTSPLSTEMFNLDAEGNIYVCRRAADIYYWFTQGGEYREASVENGGISALRIIVDGERSLYWLVPCRTDMLNQQILKFSPHFDSLLDAFYVFDSLSILDGASTSVDVTAFERDPSGNLYLVLGGYDYPDTMRLSRSDTLLCLSSGTGAYDACVIAYNPDLAPRRVFQISRLSGDMDILGGVWFHAVTYDAETQSLFLLATVQKDPMGLEDPTSHITYRGDTLDLNKNLCWLRINPADGSLLSYGKARSSGLISRTSLVNTQGDGKCLQTNLVVRNNRVFAQVSYQGNIIWRDTMIDSLQQGCGMGVMCWDADGHEVAFVDYGADADFGNRPGRLHLTDSTLWLTGILGPVDADFGTCHVYPAGGDQAYIAHYTDTAFLTPYRFVDPRVEQAIIWNQELSFPLSSTPVTLTATATSGLPVTYTCADTAIARVDGNRLHLLSVGTTTVTVHQDGSPYGYYPAAPVTNPLTVNSVGVSTVDAEQQIQVYPNPTTGKVSITTSATIVTATLTDMMGRSEEVRLTPQADGRYSLDLASRFNAVYLLSLTTNDGQQHMVRLLKQSDISGK